MSEVMKDDGKYYTHKDHPNVIFEVIKSKPIMHGDMFVSEIQDFRLRLKGIGRSGNIVIDCYLSDVNVFKKEDLINGYSGRYTPKYAKKMEK